MSLRKDDSLPIETSRRTLAVVLHPRRTGPCPYVMEKQDTDKGYNEAPNEATSRPVLNETEGA